MANTYLSRTPSGAGNKQKFTFSVWIKKLYQATGTNRRIVSSYFSNGGRHAFLAFGTDEQLYAFSGNYTSGGSTTDSYRLNSSRKFRDTNAWYHIVYRVDTTQSTASDRIRCYVNGELLAWDTSHSDHLYPSQSDENYLNSDYPIQINALNGNGIMDCCMSHIHFCDGYSYSADSFGSTDSTTGEWKINTSPSVTYGTNGFFILKDGNSVTDQSPNTNNFTVAAGTLTKTEDNPSNVFATLNPLNVPTSNAPTFANGNTTSTSSTTNGPYKWGGCTTLGMTSGKFYCEAKATVDNSYSRNVIGITGDSANIARANVSILNGTHSWGYYSENGTVSGNGSGDLSGWNTAYTTGDIIMMALDLSNNKLYFGKNGTWLNSGVPTSGSTGTGAVSIIAANTTNDGVYFFAQTDDTGTQSPSKFEFNFGNGYFGTTAVSSAGTNASGIGIFEYDVPTGYTALSTKGLNL
jgi:hypothetical protein